VSHLLGRVHRQGDRRRTGRSAIAVCACGLPVWAWRAGGFRRRAVL